MYRRDIPEPIRDKHRGANLENRLIPSQFRTWRHTVDSIFLSCMTIALWVGALNPGIQKVILNIVPTIFFVSFSFVIMMVRTTLLVVSIFIAVLLFILGPLVIQILYYYYEKNLLNENSKTAPAPDAAPLEGLVVDADGNKVTPQADVDEEVGLGLQHKRSIASDADWMLTSSESELSGDESNKDKSTAIAL